MMRQSWRAATRGAALAGTAGAWIGRLSWEGRQLWRRLRYLRWGAFGLLAGGALCLLAAVAAWEQAGTRVQLLRMQQAAEAIAPSAPDALKRAREALAALDRAMPDEAASAPVLQALLDLAAEHDLEVPGGSYLRQEELAGGFVQWHINMPVHGAADQVETFLQAALLAHPALALTRLELSAAPAQAAGPVAQVQAQPGWVLHTRMSRTGRAP